MLGRDVFDLLYQSSLTFFHPEGHDVATQLTRWFFHGNDVVSRLLLRKRKWQASSILDDFRILERCTQYENCVKTLTYHPAGLTTCNVSGCRTSLEFCFDFSNCCPNNFMDGSVKNKISNCGHTKTVQESNTELLETCSRWNPWRLDALKCFFQHFNEIFSLFF